MVSPCFVEELTKAVVESGVVVDVGSHYAATKLASTLEIPATLQASLLARLDRLAPVRQIAQIGAALGRHFSHEMISVLADMPQRQVDEALARLVTAELLYRRGVPPDAEYRFKHVLVQDTAYSTLLRPRRGQLHSRIVAVIETQFSDIAANNPEWLAQQCIEAGQSAKAIEYLQQAADASLAKSANVEALRQIQRALEILGEMPESADRNARELRLLVQKGVGLQALHGYGSQHVHANYARASEICRTASAVPNLVPTLRGLYVYHLMKGNLPTAHAIASDLLSAAERAGDEGSRLEARFAFGQTLAFHKADFPRARDVLLEGEALYDIDKHGRHAWIYGQDPGVYCLVLGGWVSYFLGHPDTGLQKARRAIALADALEHPLSRAAARIFTAQLLQWLRVDSEASTLAQEVINIAEAYNLPFFKAWADACLGLILTLAGDLKAGTEKIAEAITDWTRTAGELFLPYLRCLLATAQCLSGEFDRALADIADSIATAERNGDLFLLSEMHLLEGFAFEAAQRISDAERDYGRALQIASGQGARFLELRAAIHLGRLWAKRGERARVATLLRPICEYFVEGATCQDLADARLLLSWCATNHDQCDRDSAAMID
jgi:tetratricopeptide (TPR) repeat protein